MKVTKEQYDFVVLVQEHIAGGGFDQELIQQAFKILYAEFVPEPINRKFMRNKVFTYDINQLKVKRKRINT